jgi:hypothetical protein
MPNFLVDEREFFREPIEPGAGSRRGPFDAGEIETLFASLVLFEMQDVAVMAENKVGNSGIETLLIGTLDK